MSRIRGLVLVSIVVTVMTACCGKFALAAISDAEKRIVEGNSAFALDLYAKLKDREGNLFLSPYSISTALAMTYAGARGNTAEQMADVLHFELDRERLHPAFRAIINRINARGERGNYLLSVANALWGQKGYGFLKEFLDLAEKNYGAGLREVDFADATEEARQTINAWAERETRNKIKDLVARGVLDPATALVLTNAIYFKGNWASQFKERYTKDSPFTVSADTKVTVPMMYQMGKFNYAEVNGCQALELPYVDNELSMIILLPKEADGLAKLENVLTSDMLKTLLQNLRQEEVRVFVPRFKMTSAFELAVVLKSMGMTDAFSAGADFSGMTGNKELFISAVVHKAFVDVNEEGTEAAAATAVVMKRSAPLGPIFRADHPFLFLIRDNRSGSILFLGRLVNPLK